MIFSFMNQANFILNYSIFHRYLSATADSLMTDFSNITDLQTLKIRTIFTILV